MPSMQSKTVVKRLIKVRSLLGAHWRLSDTPQARLKIIISEFSCMLNRI
jgi:hypothetical protein